MTSDDAERYERETPETPSTLLADEEHPWLGLESFREDTRDYFFGRDFEIGELHLRLRSHPLLVVYGRSGLGKSSILNAGLIPRLRADDQRPLLVRLRYDEPPFDPVGQLTAAVFGWGDQKGAAMPPAKSLAWVRQLAGRLAVPLPEDLPSRLWLRLHARGEPLPITHLILDQFEEVFTLGARVAGRSQAVRDALAILLHGAIPEPISRLIDDRDDFLDAFDTDSVPVRVVLALRDDYVYALNRWRRHLPALGQNNFELGPLRGPAAFDAVYKPGELRRRTEPGRTLPPIIDVETAQRIVRFVAGTRPDVPLDAIEAVPPILSLLCRELNARRFTARGAPAPQVVFRESDSDMETIIAAFYERCLAGRPAAVRIFIEEELVSYSGARLAQDEGSILRVFTDGCEIPGGPDGSWADGFGNQDAARRCLDELIRERLFSPLGDQRYELIHDLLALVVDRSRTARAERLDKEHARRQAARERKTRLTASAVAIVLGVLAMFALYQLEKTRLAEASTLAAKGSADRARDDAQRANERIREGIRIRRAIYGGDAAVLQDLLEQGRVNTSLRFVVKSEPTGPKSNDLQYYSWSMSPDLSTLPAGAGIESMTYRMDHPTFTQKLYATSAETSFTANYIGWGCLRTVSVLIEYSDPEKLPEIAQFDMCGAVEP
jgi:hypothetical protein